ncbi:hypothetical protein TRFO_36282 [Tritrichomonas foetus]|uniref:Isochorismatase-like domain-containing protein n=1 Tax=Tritrichomonas foetus TaxID=1144522 RepID=A0A1J4JED5_9EUKA|nr:hypothetical protein TRFO_36282 [Tritrichomonas foetus]|eukprot:OHS97522.1 hypothetical protein TRFO_36282 [Tritrichomonas foetus]
MKTLLVEFLVFLFITSTTICLFTIRVMDTRNSSHKILEENVFLPINVHYYLENGTKQYKVINLYQNETLFYVDYWRSHWCPYYNDRDFFLSHRINEFLHIARSRGFRIFHLHWKGHEAKLDEPLRKNYKKIGEDFISPIVKDTWIDNNVNNSLYIPGFKDKCIYPNFERFGKTRCQKPNPALAFGENDIIAYNFKSIATVAHYHKAKTVILTGVHTNLCIRSAAMYLALLNISVGYIDDLLDAGFYYPTQKNHLKSHSQMNRVSLKFAETYHGWGANSYDVARELLKMEPQIHEPKWKIYPEQANHFHKYYKKVE